jgi:hypothetical protein
MNKQSVEREVTCDAKRLSQPMQVGGPASKAKPEGCMNDGLEVGRRQNACPCRQPVRTGKADGRKPESCGARRELGGTAHRTGRKASEHLAQVRKAGRTEELEENSLLAQAEMEAEGRDGGHDGQRKLEESATGKP